MSARYFVGRDADGKRKLIIGPLTYPLLRNGWTPRHITAWRAANRADFKHKLAGLVVTIERSYPLS